MDKGGAKKAPEPKINNFGSATLVSLFYRFFLAVGLLKRTIVQVDENYILGSSDGYCTSYPGILIVIPSVVDPNTLNLDPDPEC